MIAIIINLNGIYDILCALSILKIINIPILNNLHLSMIKTSDRKLINERFFAYWIFTYGIIRTSNCNYLITCSYYIEFIFITNEIFQDTVKLDWGIFVAFTSLLLGHLSLFVK
jgi:hypothetical protein